jgi:GNAT superfamily N-acetyltransferase
MLSAAIRVTRDPDDLPAALGTTLLATVHRFTTPDGGFRSGFAGSRMQVADLAGGMLQIERDAPPFTPAEYARARALVDLAAQIRRLTGVRFLVALPGGDEIEIRTGTETDAPAVAAMYDRCSTASLRARFPGGPSAVRMSFDAHLTTLVAVSGTGLVIGTGTLAFDGAEAEIAVLVEDSVQRRGVGTALTKRLAAAAASGGAEVVHAHAYAGNAGMIRTFERLGLPLYRAADGPVITLTGDLRVASGADIAVGATPPR